LYAVRPLPTPDKVWFGNATAVEMATRGDGLKELAADLSATISKARLLDLTTSVYLLSMALLEVIEALKKEEDGGDSAGR
jgi:hypothetical protein